MGHACTRQVHGSATGRQVVVAGGGGAAGGAEEVEEGATEEEEGAELGFGGRCTGFLPL